MFRRKQPKIDAAELACFRNIINRHDPVGLINGRPDPDRYAPEIQEIVRLGHKIKDRRSLVKVIEEVFESRFGKERLGESFADKIVNDLFRSTLRFDKL